MIHNSRTCNSLSILPIRSISRGSWTNKQILDCMTKLSSTNPNLSALPEKPGSQGVASIILYSPWCIIVIVAVVVLDEARHPRQSCLPNVAIAMETIHENDNQEQRPLAGAWSRWSCSGLQLLRTPRYGIRKTHSSQQSDAVVARAVKAISVAAVADKCLNV